MFSELANLLGQQIFLALTYRLVGIYNLLWGGTLMKGNKLKYWLVPGILLLAVVVVFSSGLFSSGKAQQQSVENRVTIKAVEVQYENIVPTLMLAGSIEGETSATISAKLAGRIEQVLVQEGQRVQVGTPLIKLESNELANSVRAAQGTVTKAEINYNLASVDYSRYQELYAQGAVSQQQLEIAAAQLKTAQADLSSAIANRSSAQQQYGYGMITAPVSGVIANKTATVGQVVSPGSPLMSVENLDQVYAQVNIEQKELGRVKIGQKAEITVDAYPEQVFSGVVEIINPQAGSSNRMFRTKIKIDNKDGSLKPGMFVKVQIATGEVQPVLTVPSAALIQKQGLYYVFTVEKDQAVRHQVEIAEISGGSIQIKSGLQPGDRVIVSNVNQLKDGDTVRVKN